ncbi:protein kintoun [Phycodurus eques]|uniref:protein kintoun n=1 Tax=Phycodurus eques TaxID=693459 RepID=UPI002ACDC568|nr:protein kintoun [Phycodurus eques]
MDMGEKLKELNMTGDEMKRLTKAFKDEKFRAMLNDYAREIADPENRRLYEEEIAILEQQRGNNIEFIHPKPFRALRTSVNHKQKCYINICANDKVGKPECKWGVSEDGRRGQCWSLPHNLHPGRQDTDPKGNKIMIYDVIFHPDTLHIANKKAEFMEMVSSTAIQGIQDAFKVTLDKNNVREMNTKYKGMPQPCVIRKPIPGYTAKPPEDHPLAFPYPDEKKKKISPDPRPKSFKIKNEKTKIPTEPSYTVKYRSFIDLQDFRCSRDSGKSPRPKEIVVTIDVPLLKSVADASLEVKEKTLLLESETPAYRLEMLLSYPVDEQRGDAKFSKQRGQLTVTLPVLPSNEAMELCWSNDGMEGGTEEQEMEAEKSQVLEEEVIKGRDGVEGEQPVMGDQKEDIGEEKQLNEKGTYEELEEEQGVEEKRREDIQENGEQNVLYIKESLVNLNENKSKNPMRKEDALQRIDLNQENPASLHLLQITPVLTTEPSSVVEDAHVNSYSDSSHQVKDADTQEAAKAGEKMKKDQGEELEIGDQEKIDISEEEQLTEKVTCEELVEEEQIIEEKRREVEEDIQEAGEHDVLHIQESQVKFNENENIDPVREKEQLTGKRTCKEHVAEEQGVGEKRGEEDDTQETGERDALCIQENKRKDQVREEDAPQRMDSDKENPACVDLLQISPARENAHVDAYLDSSAQVKNVRMKEAAETEEKDVKMEIDTLQEDELSGEAPHTETSLKNINATSETQEEAFYTEGDDKVSHIPEERTPLSTKDDVRMEEEEQDLPEKRNMQKPEPDKKPPPVLLREIDEDGNVTVFSDHATSAGFLFQNSLMYELD